MTARNPEGPSTAYLRAAAQLMGLDRFYGKKARDTELTRQEALATEAQERRERTGTPPLTPADFRPHATIVTQQPANTQASYRDSLYHRRTVEYPTEVDGMYLSVRYGRDRVGFDTSLGEYLHDDLSRWNVRRLRDDLTAWLHATA